MKKMIRFAVSVFLIAALCLCFAGCFDTGDGGGDEMSFTISLKEDAVAGQRAEILVQKNGNFSLNHDDYTWNVIGENTVGAEFVFEDLDRNDGYMNKFLFVKYPGTVQIQAKNTTNGELLSNILTVVVTGEEISTVEELKALAGTSKTVILAGDIDLSEEENWSPIENFSGTLVGRGYKITGLTISSVNGENLGLFGVLNGTVMDLVIEDAQISSRGDIGKIGIVAGTNKGTIENVKVSGSVTAAYYDDVGGIAGYSEGVILSCENQAVITGQDHVGGIAGTAAGAANDFLNKNVNNGEVHGNSDVGGVVGLLSSQTRKTDSNFASSVAENENNAAVEGKTRVGGVAGAIIPAGQYASNWYGKGYMSISVFKNTGDVVANGDFAGGIVGYAERLTEISVCENEAPVTGWNYVGGFVGKSEGTALHIATNDQTITGKGYVGGIAGYIGEVKDAKNNGEVVSTAIIVENSASRSYVGGIAGYCTALISCENTASISVANGSYVGGLAGYLKMSDSEKFNGNENSGDIRGCDSVGGLVGYLGMATVKTDSNFNRSFSENVNHGNVSGTSEVGGIAGSLVGAEKYASNWYGLGHFDVSICTNNGEIVGTGSNVGGLFGLATRLSTMTVCENNGDVSGQHYVGGFVGSGTDANIKLATNNNTVTGYSYVGGIAGKAGKMENCTNSGTVLSLGVSLENSVNVAYVGGVAGYCTALLNCANNSDLDVTTGGCYVGGLAGYILFSADNMVNDNQNLGNISSTGSYVGGIAGYVKSVAAKTDSNYTRTISGNKNVGDVSGQGNVGGVFGYVYGADRYASNWYGYCYIVMTYCTNEGEASGSSCVGGVVGGYTRLNTDSNVMGTNSTLSGELLGM